MWRTEAKVGGDGRLIWSSCLSLLLLLAASCSSMEDKERSAAYSTDVFKALLMPYCAVVMVQG
jgi:hypothetical protein